MIMEPAIKITEVDRLRNVYVQSFETYTTTTADPGVVADERTIVLTPDRDSLRAVEMLEAAGFNALSEDSFAEDWNSPEDAVYDTL